MPVLERISSVIEEGARDLNDAMTDYRGQCGEPLAERLATVAPEDRTWLQAGEVASKGATDFLDGRVKDLLNLLFGPPDEERARVSREKDRGADRGFVMPQQWQLTLNGERPPVYFALKLLRESRMNKDRQAAESRGIDVSSKLGGRLKTTSEIGELVTAHSEWATKPDLIRWEASLGNGFSYIDWIETKFRFRREAKGRNAEAKTARNNGAREIVEGPFGRAAGLLHRAGPGIKPSHITKFGLRLGRLANSMVLTNPDEPALPVVLNIVSDVADAFDGPYARATKQESPEGERDDVETDLKKQIETFANESVIAHRRGNMVAATNYALATMLVGLSSYYRAEAETRGLIVDEAAIGGRVGMAVFSNAGMAFNRHRDLSDIVSGMAVASKILTIVQRHDVVKHGRDSDYCVGTRYDEEFMERAQARLEVIAPYAKQGLAIGALLLVRSGYSLVAHEGERPFKPRLRASPVRTAESPAA